MNNYNDNFLLNEEADSQYESAIDEVIGESDQEDSTDSVLSEVVKRIEQAKLYEALLKHDLFAPGSARPEIIKAVRKEFKDFIHGRLEILLGIRHEASQPQVQVQSPFSQEEVEALKALSGRLIQNKTKPQIQANTPVVNTLINQDQVSVQPTPTVKVNPIINNPPVTQQPVKKKATKRKTANVSEITGQDYSQAVSPRIPPKKMPSQVEIDAMNARTAAINSGQSGGGSNEFNRILGLAISASQAKNKDVIE